MSYAEIADVMGRSPAAVKSLLARARNQLREQLEPYLLTGQRNSRGRNSVTELVSCIFTGVFLGLLRQEKPRYDLVGQFRRGPR